MSRNELLGRMKSMLSNAFGDRLRGVVLYGSEARGQAGPDSDIDVLVLLDRVDSYWADLRQCIHALYPLVLELGRPIDSRPVDVRVYEEGAYPIYQHASKEGVRA